MPAIVPPSRPPGIPARHVLPAGTQVWRVHNHYRDADQFSPPTSSAFGGGRFDATVSGGRGQLYAAPKRSTAIAEKFMPDLRFDQDGLRFLPRKTLETHTLSAITTKTDLTLLRLTTNEDLAAIGQDHWLLSASAEQYALTREWAAWIRKVMPWAQGIVWRSLLDSSRFALVLFEPDDDDPVIDAEAELSYQLAGMAKEAWLAETLRRHGVSTDPPQRPQPRVFINYRSVDGADAARMMANAFARRLGEQRVFRDVESIPPGTPYAGELLDKARGVIVLLVLVGPNWEHHRDSTGRAIDNPDDWVRREIIAAAEARVNLVPVLVGTRPKLRESSLPEPVRQLAKVQFCHLPNGFTEVHTNDVVKTLLTWFPELES